MKAEVGSYQVYVGSECVSHSTNQAKETLEFQRLSKELPNKAIFLAKTEVLATNAVANIAIRHAAR